ncbi:MAG: Fe-S cluster assembly sulfur transfer protein SufU [Gemmatimonadota bacterium]
MSSELEALYQEVILDHNRNPRNFREMPDATRHVSGRNPLCGDEVTVYVKLKNDVIEDVSFGGKGCAISKASASLMTNAIKGKSLSEARELYDRFRDLVTASPTQTAGSTTDKSLGRLAVLGGVARFPARVKCATLAWHALQNAITDGEAEVTTDDQL